jgi:hypothetical protein
LVLFLHPSIILGLNIDDYICCFRVLVPVAVCVRAAVGPVSVAAAMVSDGRRVYGRVYYCSTVGRQWGEHGGKKDGERSAIKMLNKWREGGFVIATQNQR